MGVKRWFTFVDSEFVFCKVDQFYFGLGIASRKLGTEYLFKTEQYVILNICVIAIFSIFYPI